MLEPSRGRETVGPRVSRAGPDCVGIAVEPMFDTLSTRLGEIFDRLRGRGALSEDDVGAAMREIRVALLEADVALPVVRDFIAAEIGRAHV